MAKESRSKLYTKLREHHPQWLAAWEGVTAACHDEQVLDAKTAHLIQIVAAAAARSEGAVHSHVRRALDGGVAPRAIEQALLLATTSIGFPAVAAALSWAGDVTDEAGQRTKPREA